MRVAIGASMRPFVPQSRATAERLAVACRDAGHHVELVWLPWSGNRHVVRQLGAYRWIDLASSSDRLISLNLPALVLAHPAKVVWMTRSTPCVSGHLDGVSPDAGRADDVEAGLRDIERSALAEAAAVHVSERCNLHLATHAAGAGPLRVPPEPPDGRESVTYDREFVCMGPIRASNRVDVVIDAVALGRSGARVRFLGGFDDPAYETFIRTRVATMNVADRVSFIATPIEPVTALAAARAVIQLGVPCDDLIVAAARRAKIVVAPVDSLGTVPVMAEMVHSVEPTAEALAGALDHLTMDAWHARHLGLIAAERVRALLPTWDAVASHLLQ